MAKQLPILLCLGSLLSAPAISRRPDNRGRESGHGPGNCPGGRPHRPHGDHSVAAGHRGHAWTCRQNAARFDQVKVGDPVTATYYDRISVRVKPAGEPPSIRRWSRQTTATPGTLPGATRTQAARGDGHHHRLVAHRQGRDLQRTERHDLLTPAAGHHRPQHRLGSQGGRSRGRHADRGSDACRSSRAAHARHPEEPPDGFGPGRSGQPVQRQDDQGMPLARRRRECQST